MRSRHPPIGGALAGLPADVPHTAGATTVEEPEVPVTIVSLDTGGCLRWGSPTGTIRLVSPEVEPCDGSVGLVVRTRYPPVSGAREQCLGYFGDPGGLTILGRCSRPDGTQIVDDLEWAIEDTADAVLIRHIDTGSYLKHSGERTFARPRTGEASRQWRIETTP